MQDKKKLRRRVTLTRIASKIKGDSFATKWEMMDALIDGVVAVSEEISRGNTRGPGGVNAKLDYIIAVCLKALEGRRWR